MDEKKYWIIQNADEDGNPSEFILKTLSFDKDEAWEKLLAKEIQEDIKSQNRSPRKPFPLYDVARSRAEMYGVKSVCVKIIKELTDE